MKEQSVEVDVKAIQVMRCTTCCPTNTRTSSSSRSATRQRKGVLQCNPLYKLTSMKNHMVNEYLPEFKKYKAMLTVLEELKVMRQKTKKMTVVQPLAITIFLSNRSHIKKVTFNTNIFFRILCFSLQTVTRHWR